MEFRIAKLPKELPHAAIAQTPEANPQKRIYDRPARASSGNSTIAMFSRFVNHFALFFTRQVASGLTKRFGKQYYKEMRICGQLRECGFRLDSFV
jgi:hypothetical protein